MRFRTVLLIGLVALIGAILVATVVAIRHVVDGAARRGLADVLARATTIIDDVQRFRQSALRAEARMVAEEPRLKAVAGTAGVNPETILGVAQDMRAAIASDLFLLTDAEGAVLADTADPARSGGSMHDSPLIATALRDGEAGGVWIVDQRAVQVAAKRLAFGDQAIGVLVIGRAFDDQLAETIRNQAGALVALELGGRPIARSTGTEDLERVAIGRAPAEVVLRGTRYLAVGVDMRGYAGSQSLRYVILGDHDRAMAPGRALLGIVYSIAALSLLIAIVLAFVFAVRMSRPIDELVAFTKVVAARELGTQARISGPTELRTLGSAINGMVRELRSLTEGLEHRVEQRTSELRATTRELDDRNRGMRLVLDNVAQGFLTIDLDGAIAAERSAVVERWFGKLAADITFAELVRPHAPEFAIWTELGLQALCDGFLPTEVCTEQLPRRFAANGRTFDVTYSPITSDARIERLLVILTDVTEHLERERAEQEQRELLALFQRVSTDRDGCEEFMREASALIAGLGQRRDRAVEHRALHTLKGNCAIFGFERYAALCHAIETELAEPDSRGVLTDAQRVQLRDGWSELSATMSRLLGDSIRNTLEISMPELAAVVDAARSGMSGRELAPVLASWMHEPIRRRFDRLGHYAVGLARRLGKGQLEVSISDGGLRLDTARWAALWSGLVHVVRNAVDHGFTPPGSGPRPSVLSLAATRTPGQIVLTIADNGQGIDWEALRACARRAGLPHTTHEDLVEALFADGISTRAQVTETSGRGVGMAALRATVLALGGTIEVESQRGSGAYFAFRFAFDAPAERRDPATASLVHVV